MLRCYGNNDENKLKVVALFGHPRRCNVSFCGECDVRFGQAEGEQIENKCKTEKKTFRERSCRVSVCLIEGSQSAGFFNRPVRFSVVSGVKLERTRKMENFMHSSSTLSDFEFKVSLWTNALHFKDFVGGILPT